MYIFVIGNEIRDIENRHINLEEYYHKNILDYFKEIPDGTEVEIGDFYVDGKIIKPGDMNE